MHDERILIIGLMTLARLLCLGNFVAQLFITTFYITTRADVSTTFRGLLLWTLARKIFTREREARFFLVSGEHIEAQLSICDLTWHERGKIVSSRCTRSSMKLGNCIITRRLVNDDGITIFEVISRSNLYFCCFFSWIKKHDSLAMEDSVQVVRIHMFLAWKCMLIWWLRKWKKGEKREKKERMKGIIKRII